MIFGFNVVSMIMIECTVLFLMSHQKFDFCCLLFHSDSVHIGTAGTKAEEEFKVQKEAKTEYRGGRR